MADDKEKKIKITVDADEATKQLQEIKEALAQTQKELADLQATSKKTEKATSNIAGGFKSIGNALKGLGIITLVVAAFSKLKEIFMSNAKVAESVNTVMNFITLTFQKVVEVIVAIVEKVGEMSKKMDGTKAVINDLIKIALTPLKLEFYAIVLGVKSLILGWTQLFDKKNTEKIKSLTDDVAELKDKLKETAQGAVDAAKDFGKNIGKAVSEVGNVMKETGKVIKKGYDDFDAKETMNQAKRLANAKEFYGNMAIAAQKEIDSLEAISEKHRQDRDDTNKSFEERKKANEELIASNEAQYQAALKLAEAHIEEAKANAQLDNSVENRLAVQAAMAEKEKAYADWQGKISEQKAAALGLIKEEIDAQNALTQATTDAAFEEQKIEANRIKNDEDRIKRLKEIEDAQYEANKKSLEDSMASMEKNSQAYITAQTELVNLTKAHNSTMAGLDDELTKVKEDNIQKLNDLKKADMDNDKLSYEKRIQSANEYYDALIKKAQESGQITTDIEKQKNDAINALELERKQKAIDTSQQSIDYIRNLDEQYTQYKQNLLQNQLKNGQITQAQFDKKSAELEKKAAQRKKAYAIGDAIISTAQSVIGFLAKPGGIPGIALSVGAGILGAAQIATIASTPVDGSSSGSAPSGGSMASSSGAGTGTAPSTSFSFADAPKTPEIQPARTYVISKEVTTQQELDRQIISNGTI